MEAKNYLILGVIGIIGVVALVYYKNIIGFFTDLGSGLTQAGKDIAGIPSDIGTGIGTGAVSLLNDTGANLTITGSNAGQVQVQKPTYSISPIAGTSLVQIPYQKANGNMVLLGNINHNGTTYTATQLLQNPSILGSIQSQIFPTYSMQGGYYIGIQFNSNTLGTDTNISIPSEIIPNFQSSEFPQLNGKTVYIINTPLGTGHYFNGNVYVKTSIIKVGNIAGVMGWI